MAAQLLQEEAVPVDYQDYKNEAEEYADLIADNRLAELSEIDDSALRSLLSELDATMGLSDIELTGFNEIEFADMITMGGSEIGETPNAELDKIDEIHANWKVKEGDIWIIGEHRLMCGSSIIKKDVDSLFNGQIPFIMVTDPPYGVDYDPEWRKYSGLQKTTPQKGKVKNDHIFDWTKAYDLFNGTVAYVWHSARFTSEVATNLKQAGFEIRASIIWKKQRIVIGRGHYHWQHEPCWYAYRSNGDSAKWCGDRKQSTIWEINNLNGTQDEENEKTGHGTQKPVECMARPIRNHGTKEDIIYDPFCGSGTTMVAAEVLKRKSFCMELDQRYCSVILERMSKMRLKITKLHVVH